MSWNNSDDDNKKKQDPWSKPGNDGNDSNNKRPDKKQDGLPDLEELFKNLIKKFGGSNNNFNSNIKAPKYSNKLIAVFGVIALAIWGISGFYTINEAEQGVILRLGKKQQNTVLPGLNWKPTFIDQVIPINISEVNILQTQGAMLTQDENMVKVEINVHYRIDNPVNYLFSVTNPKDTLSQATDSALRYVVGHMKMDDIITKGRAEVKEKTWKLLNNIIAPYNMGLEVTDVNFQSARPPEEVKEAFDDAIKAQEDEQRFIKEAEAYAKEKEPIASGDARRIVEKAVGYKEKVVLDAEGEVARFSKLIPAFRDNPRLLKERLYIDTMEKVMENNPKVLLDANNNVNILSLDKLFNSATDTKVIKESELNLQRGNK